MTEALLIVVLVCVALYVNYLVSREFYKVAVAKGYEDKKYFWYSFFLTTVGYLLVIALPTKNTSL